MKSTVILFPGSNRDQDMISAITKISGQKPNLIWHTESEIPKTDLIVIPGGFSFGDYLRSGAIAARSPVMNAIRLAAENGTHVIGVCNGFQILCEAGLLDGALLHNNTMKLLNAGNAKTKKGEKLGIITYGIHLAPYNLSGFNVCQHASAGWKLGRGIPLQII